jgi:hypothetical protein
MEFNDACHSLCPLANIKSESLISLYLLRNLEAVLKFMASDFGILYIFQDIFNMYSQGEDECNFGLLVLQERATYNYKIQMVLSL